MGEYEDQLQAIMSGPAWDLPQLPAVRDALVGLSRTLRSVTGVISDPEVWSGAAAEAAAKSLSELTEFVDASKVKIDGAEEAIELANRHRSEAVYATDTLPSAEVPSFYRNAALVSSTVVHPYLGPLAADKAVDIIEGFLGNKREDAAKKAVNDLQEALKDPEKKLREAAEAFGDGEFEGEPVPVPVPIPDPDRKKREHNEILKTPTHRWAPDRMGGPGERPSVASPTPGGGPGGTPGGTPGGGPGTPGGGPGPVPPIGTPGIGTPGIGIPGIGLPTPGPGTGLTPGVDPIGGEVSVDGSIVGDGGIGGTIGGAGGGAGGAGGGAGGGSGWGGAIGGGLAAGGAGAGALVGGSLASGGSGLLGGMRGGSGAGMGAGVGMGPGGMIGAAGAGGGAHGAGGGAGGAARGRGLLGGSGLGGSTGTGGAGGAGSGAAGAGARGGGGTMMGAPGAGAGGGSQDRKRRGTGLSGGGYIVEQIEEDPEPIILPPEAGAGSRDDYPKPTNT